MKIEVEEIEVEYLPANRSFLGGSECDSGGMPSVQPKIFKPKIFLRDEPPLFSIPSAGADD